jgi:hypothetical protein
MPAITQGYYAQYYAAVDELSGGRQGTPLDLSNWHREYVRNFLVIVRRKGMSAIDVCSAPLLPLPGSFYVTADGLEYDLLARAYKFSAKQRYDDEAKWDHWVATVEYSTKWRSPDGTNKIGWPSKSGKDGGASNDPTLEPIEISYDFQEGHYSPQRDLDGELYASSAGQMFAPAPQFPGGNSVVTITRNERDFNIVKQNIYAYVVNDSRFGFAPRDCVMCLPPIGKLSNKGPIDYHRVTYKLKVGRLLSYVFNPDTNQYDAEFESWQPRLLDQGTMVLEQVEAVRIDDAEISVTAFKQVDIIRDGSKVSKPVLLNGDGREAAVSIDPVTDLPYIPPTYINYREFRRVDLKELLVRGLSNSP